MDEERKVEIVKKTFEAFGRGDLPTIMKYVAEDAEYRSPVTRTPRAELSWASPRNGPQEVMQSFAEMAEKVMPEPFVVTNIIAQGDQVAVEGRNKGTVRSTGKRYEHDWAMIFSFKGEKIIRCYHYYDTADILMAF